jgi:hypothetical protein
MSRHVEGGDKKLPLATIFKVHLIRKSQCYNKMDLWHRVDHSLCCGATQITWQEVAPCAEEFVAMADKPRQEGM